MLMLFTEKKIKVLDSIKYRAHEFIISVRSSWKNFEFGIAFEVSLQLRSWLDSLLRNVCHWNTFAAYFTKKKNVVEEFVIIFHSKWWHFSKNPMMSRLCGAIRFAINFYTFNGVTRVSTNNLRQFDGKKLIPHNLD